jgi:GNAT superfamily N-acetyltransferase
MTLKIRNATALDIPQVHEMMGLLARHHGDTATISMAEMQRQIFDLGLGRIVVAAEAEGLVGYALLMARPNLVTGGVGHDINHLFVVEWRRRAGIGRALIAALREVSRGEGAEVLTISAQAENRGAITAYHEMGLQEMPKFGVRFRIDLRDTSGPTA